MKKKIYLDMDGVLADFNGWAAKELGATDQERQDAADQGRWLPWQWKRLTRDQHLYRHLPKTDWADELVSLARQFRDDLDWQLLILTAIPKNNDVPSAFYDKVLWTQQHFPDIPVHFGPYSRDKHLHANTGDLLIDDRLDNCQDWQRAGGYAIRVLDHNPRLAIRELTDYLTGAKNTDN